MIANVNPLNIDPSRTKTLRNKFRNVLRGRYAQLHTKINQLFKEDAFGFKLFNNQLFRRDPVGLTSILDQFGINTRWAFLDDEQKAEQFHEWLEEQTDTIIVESDQFWEEFIRQGFERGAGRSFEQLKGAAIIDESLKGFAKAQFVSSIVGPESISKVKLLAGRTFASIQGLNQQNILQIKALLLEGLVEGQNPRTISRRISQRINTTKRQAERIARTEIIRAHAEGQLDGMEALGVTEVGVAVEWLVTRDGRLCPQCSALSGVVMSIEKARGLIPLHPNCRCAFLPANVGEQSSSQKRSRKRINEAIKRSLDRGADEKIRKLRNSRPPKARSS